jgi:putative flippase GtrA
MDTDQTPTPTLIPTRGADRDESPSRPRVLGRLVMISLHASHRPAAAVSPRRGGRTATFAASLVDAAAGRLGRELVTFGVIGVISTAAYAVLFLALRAFTGATAANALALVITAVGNTAANRRLTFGVRGGGSMARDQLGGLAALAITTASVSLLAALAPRAGHLVELAVLVVANVLATVARFVLLRSWIAGDRRRAPTFTSTPSDHQE